MRHLHLILDLEYSIFNLVISIGICSFRVLGLSYSEDTDSSKYISNVKDKKPGKYSTDNSKVRVVQ
jgi:hypothetical protein